MLQQSPKPPAPAEPDIAAVLREGSTSGRARRLVYVVVAVLVVGGGLFAWWMTRAGTADVVYTTQPVTRGDLTVTVTATGTVEPTNVVEVSSELSGLIASVSVDFNDTVKQGQPLAMLKTDKLQANVAVAKATLDARDADVAQAQANVNDAATALQRAQQLIDKGVATQETFDTAKSANESGPRRRSPRPRPIAKSLTPTSASPSRTSTRPASARRWTASSSAATSRSARPSPLHCRRRCCSPSPTTSPRCRPRSI